MLKTTDKSRRSVMASVVILVMAATGVLVGPAAAAVGVGTSQESIIDTLHPFVIVDQFPEFTVYQGGDIVSFHWQSFDHYPGTVPEYYTATALVDGQPDSTISYFPDTGDFTWEWIVPEISTSHVHVSVLATDAFGNSTTATSNNFTILSSVTDVPRPTEGLRLAQPRPNPFNPSTRLEFNLPETGRVDLTVFDARGRRISTLVQGIRPTGIFEARWDGSDDRGRPQAGGVYLFVLDFQGPGQSGRITRKAVLVP